MAKYNMKIHTIDNGFCRINYKWRAESGEWYYFCLQDEGNGQVIAYSSTSEEEPCSPIKTEKVDFEIPTGNSTIEIIIREWLLKQKEGKN